MRQFVEPSRCHQPSFVALKAADAVQKSSVIVPRSVVCASVIRMKKQEFRG